MGYEIGYLFLMRSLHTHAMSCQPKEPVWNKTMYKKHICTVEFAEWRLVPNCIIKWNHRWLGESPSHSQITQQGKCHLSIPYLSEYWDCEVLILGRWSITHEVPGYSWPVTILTISDSRREDFTRLSDKRRLPSQGWINAFPKNSMRMPPIPFF